MKIFLIIITLLIVIILFIPIGVRIIYDNTYSDIDVFIFKNLKHKFDLDSFVRRFIMDKNDSSRISLTTIINNLELSINSKKTMRDILKTIDVKKSTIVFKQDYNDYILFVFFWNVVSRYTYIIRKSFKSVENEYYMSSDNDNEISIELVLKIKLIYILIALLKNINEVFKVLKIRRRQKKNGTSNL